MELVLSVASCCSCSCMCVCLCVADCPKVTPAGLKHLSNFTELRSVSLSGMPDNWLTNRMLESLFGCSQLWWLRLGDKRTRQLASFTTGYFG